MNQQSRLERDCFEFVSAARTLMSNHRKLAIVELLAKDDDLEPIIELIAAVCNERAKASPLDFNTIPPPQHRKVAR